MKSFPSQDDYWAGGLPTRPRADVRERHPVLSAPQWTPNYGPHLCPVCYGVGQTQGDAGLVACPRCGSGTPESSPQLLEEVWKLSGMNPNQSNPPSLDAFPTKADPAAARMLQAAREFVAGKMAWLTFYGPPGGLKSTLGQAIARWFLAQHRACLYMRAPDLFFHLGAVARGKDDPDYEARLYQASRIKVLIIDEFGKEGESEFVQRVRTSLLDTRYQRALSGQGGQTVLLTNFAPEEWSDQALASRAQDAQFVCLPSSKIDYRAIRRRV